MLIEAFGANGDPEGAAEHWKSLLPRQVDEGHTTSDLESWAWDSLRSLFKTRVISNSEIIALCMLRLTQAKLLTWHDTLHELTGRLDDISTDDRICFWKGIIQMARKKSQEVSVSELKRALAEKSGPMSQRLEFWKIQVRKFPESAPLSEALQEAFEMEGKEAIALEFWTKLQKQYPKVRRFTKFLAKNYNSIGDYESAIRAWTVVLDDNLHQYQNYADVNSVIEELDNIVAFERDSVQRVQFWRESLDRIPAKRYYDERLRKLATAILQRSSELPLHTRLDELKMAAMECPQHNEVAKALRNEFRRVDRDGDEETFWRHVQSKSECRSFGPWPRVRLAEFYFSRRDYFTRRYNNKVLDCVVRINSNIHGDTEVWDAIGQVIPPKSVEFGLGWLRWSPDCERITEYLRSACVDPDRSYLGMWQELFVQSGGRGSPIAETITSVMISEKVELSDQVQYWKSMIQRYPHSTLAYRQLKEVLSAVGGTVRPDISSEIDVWMSICPLFYLNPPLRYNFPLLADYLHDAWQKLADSTVSTDFWKTAIVWRQAEACWSEIGEKLAGAGNLELTEIIREFHREARQLSLFFNSCQSSDFNLDVPDAVPSLDEIWVNCN